MLKLVLGRINGGKTTYVQNILGGCAENGEDKLFLIVPEQFSFESEKRILTLFGEKKAQRVEVCGFSRLAQNLLGDTGIRKPGSAGRVVLMSLALEQVSDKLQVYGRFSRSVSVISEMLKLSDELTQCAVDPGQLEQAAYKLPDGMLRKKLLDLSLIVSAFNALVATRFADERDNLTALADYLKSNQIFAGATVVLDGFKGFTQQELDIISLIIAQSENIYITLCTDEVYGGEYDISPFACVRKTAKRLIEIAKRCGVSAGACRVPEYEGRYACQSLAYLEKNLYVPGAESFGGDADEVTVFSARTVYEECDYVALQIKKLLREEKYRCRDIAVIARSEGSYSKALRASLKKHGVPVFEDKRRPLSAQPTVVLVRAALEIAARGFSSDAVFRVLKTQLAGLNVEETSELEDYVYLWQIDGAKWLKEWKQNPSGLGNAATEQDEKTLAHLNSLRVRCVSPLDKLRSAVRDADSKTIIKEIYNYLIRIKAPDNLKALAVALNESGEQADALEMGRVWDQLMDIFDRMAVSLGEDTVKPARLLELFALVLGVQDMGVIPNSIDEIVIGSADRIRFNRPRAVFAVGVNDGVFPLRPTGGRVLGDADRRALSELGVSVAEPSQFSFLEERYIAYNALCSAKERLFISYYKTDFGGGEGTPSELITQVIRLLPKCRQLDISDFEPLDLIESEASAFELAAKGWGDNTALESTLKSCFADMEEYSPRIAALNRAQSGKDYKIADKATAVALFGKNIFASATRIEDYGRCPFLFYCRHGLKLNERRVAEIDSMLGGTIVHFVLENMVRKFGKALAEMENDTVRAEVTKLLNEFLNENMGGDEEINERFSFLYARMCDSLCVVVSRLVNEMRHSDFEPADFELQIGGDDAPIIEFVIDLPDGGKILLNGKVDRVDVLKAEDQTFVRVMDYKTGTKKFDLSDVMHGLNMQMLLYLFAIRAGGSERYGKVTPAGILYVPAKSKSGRIPRSADKDEIERMVVDDGRMSGIILDDARVVHATDKDETGTIIAGRNGLKDSLISLAALGKLEKTVCEIVRKMGAELHDGRIPAMPNYGGSYHKPCDYCQYGDICLHEDCDAENNYSKMKFADCIGLLEKEDGEDA